MWCDAFLMWAVIVLVPRGVAPFACGGLPLVRDKDPVPRYGQMGRQVIFEVHLYYPYSI